MTRFFLVRRLLRDVYGAQPRNDANITDGYVNALISDAIGIAIKQNYKESIQLDGVAYVNSSFYVTFKGLAVVKDERFLYKVTLPSLPLGIGKNEGVSSLVFKDTDGNISQDCIPLTIAQKSYNGNMRVIPNKTLYYAEGKYIYAKSTNILTGYTATTTIITGGDTDINSELNVPDDYVNIIQEYVSKILMRDRMAVKDNQNDGVDV